MWVFKTKFIIATIAVTSLLGCSNHGYRASPMDIPADALSASFDQTEPLIDYSTYLPEDWWSLFDDPQLGLFVETALASHPTLEQAHAKLLLASAKADTVRSILFPNLLWGGDISRQKLSETGLIPFVEPTPGTTGPAPAQLAATGGKAGIPVYFTQFETEFNMAFDFDIWQKNRNTWHAALSEVQASLADEAFVRIQLSVAVAQTYYQLQIDYERLAIANRQVALNDQYVKLSQGRLKSGLDPLTNVQAAEINLASARQISLQLQGTIALNENRLRSYLAGQYDEDINSYPINQQHISKLPIPCDLPLRLIAHRPDIIAQLWLIESAGRQIEVAKAGFYPDFSINALFGFQTIHLHKLFQWPSVFFNVDPAVSLPIFDGGRLSANLLSSEVNYDLAIFQYNEKILNAVREVLDALALVRNGNEQLVEFKGKRSLQEESNRLIQLRVQNNLSSDLDAIVSESQVLTAKDLELTALGSTVQAILLLVKAVGGGFEASYIEG